MSITELPPALAPAPAPARRIGPPPSIARVTWSRFVVRNLVPVTLGNVIGGAVLVGLVYWFVYLRTEGADKADVHP